MDGLRDPLLWLQAVIAVALLALAAVAIRRWGPGRLKRSVYCPETSLRAKVAVLRKEADWGTFRATDITACSRFPGGGPVSCQKNCLARL